MTTINLDTVIRRADLDRLLSVLEPSAVLGVIKLRLLEFVHESFETRGRGGWKPLAMSTLALRMRGGDVPLQDTGRYKQSFVSESDNQTHVEVGTSLKAASGVPLGPIHEHGTGPYTIRVNRARVLAAKTRAGTWMIFGREVRHPGIPARPVLPTVRQAEDALKPTLEGMLERTKDGGD